MGILSRIAAWWMPSAPPLPMGNLAAFEAWMDGRGAPFVRDAEQAMRIATVHCCVKVLGESVAGLPCKLYRTDDDRREVARDHPLHRFVSSVPGPRLTPFELFEDVVVSCCLSGVSVRQKVVDGLGKLLDTRALDPTLLKPLDSEGERYEYRPPNAAPRVFTRAELWIVSYFQGLSPLAVAAGQLDQAQAQDTHATRYFENNTVLGGVLKFPGQLSEDAQRELLRKWNAQHQGSGQAWRAGLLSGGLDWVPYAVSNRDAQFLEARRFTSEQIAAIYRVPLHMLNDLTRATFSNVEHQDIAFVKHSLRPWLNRIEESMNRDLLTDAEQADGMYFAFSVDAILRGDYPTRMNGYAVGVQNGILTPNECRAWEDLPPKDGGDDLLMPMNARPGGVASTAPGGGRTPAGTPETSPAAAAADEDEETPDA